MKDPNKLAVFIIGDSESLCRELQNLLFNMGYHWLGIGNKYFDAVSNIGQVYNNPACISIHNDKALGCQRLFYYKNNIDFKGVSYFDARTEWDKILKFLDNNAEIENPNIYFKGIGYKI